MSTKKCPHPAMECYFLPSVSEDGWQCSQCREPIGWRPDLDEKLIDRKVSGLLMDLHESKLVYVSNGTEGEWITDGVARRCRELGRYDQLTILREILLDPNVDTEGCAEYWSKKATRRGLESV